MIQEQAGVAGPQPGQVRVGTPPCDHPEEPTPLAAQTNKDSNNLVLTVGASEDPSADEPPKKDAQSDPAPAPVFSDQQIEDIITGDFPGLPDCPPMWDIEDRLHPIAPQDIATEMQRLLAIRAKREPPELLKEVCTHLGRSLSSHEVNVLCAPSEITDPAEWVTWFEDTLAVCEEARKANRDFTVHSMEVAAIAPWFPQLRALPKPLIGAVSISPTPEPVEYIPLKLPVTRPSAFRRHAEPATLKSVRFDQLTLWRTANMIDVTIPLEAGTKSRCLPVYASYEHPEQIRGCSYIGPPYPWSPTRVERRRP